MPIEQLSYAQIAERLGISFGAARALVKRNRLARALGNDGKCRVAIDLGDLDDTALPDRGADAHSGSPVEELQAHVARLEVDHGREQRWLAGHYDERGRERTDRLVAALLEAGRALRAREGELLTLPTRPRWWRWLRHAR
jgi:hypothetical protein